MDRGLWLSMVWMLPLCCVVLRDMAKFKKNIALGVTLPHEAREDPEVQALLTRFRGQMGLAAVALPCLQLFLFWALLPADEGWSVLLYWLWVYGAVGLLEYMRVSAHRRLRAIKEERGWSREREKRITISLTEAAQPPQRAPLLHLALALLLALTPSAVELLRGNRALLPALLVFPVMMVMLCGLQGLLHRRKSDVVDDNARLTHTLTRLRRGLWRRRLIWSGWLLGLISLTVWLAAYRPLAGLLLMWAAEVALAVAVWGGELRYQRELERLTEDSGQDSYVDEDQWWLLGVYYYNPNDRRLFANGRTGSGVSFNLARRPVQAGAAALLILCLTMPLMGVRMVLEDYRLNTAPVTIQVTEHELRASHGDVMYALRLDDIEQARLLTAYPSDLLPSVGSGGMGESVVTNRIHRGRFYTVLYDWMTVCTDFREGPWLLVRHSGGRYSLLGEGVDGDVLSQLAARGVPEVWRQ